MAKVRDRLKRLFRVVHHGLLWVRKRLPGSQIKVPTWCAAQAIGFVVGSGISYAVFHLCSTYAPPLTPIAGAGLSAGERPFPLEARGWLNGLPPAWSNLADKVVVVDVWSDW